MQRKVYGDADDVPAGWMSALGWSKLWKKSLYLTRRLIDAGVKSGLLEVGGFRTPIQHGTRKVRYFRQTKK